MGCKSTCCVVDSQNAVKQSAAYCYEHGGGVAFSSRSNNGQRDVQDDTETRATREALGDDDDDDVASDFGFGFDGV